MRGHREPLPDQQREKIQQPSQGEAPALSCELTPMQQLQPPESKSRVTHTPITFTVDSPSGCLSFRLLTCTLPHGRWRVCKEGSLVGNLLSPIRPLLAVLLLCAGICTRHFRICYLICPTCLQGGSEPQVLRTPGLTPECHVTGTPGRPILEQSQHASNAV